jgi:hypothetical protein
MGAIAKKRIGIIATATAAAMVTMLIDNAKVESFHRPKTANNPAMTRTPSATVSAMINVITLLRGGLNIGC